MSVAASDKLIEYIDEFYQSNFDVSLVSVCTPDGFTIYQAAIDRLEDVPDKIAAIASTLASMSKSIAEELINGICKVTYIEADEGNFICIGASYLSQDIVLAVYAKQGLSIGELRLKTRYLVTSISELIK